MPIHINKIIKTPKLITLKKYCELTGETKGAVYQRIYAANWLLNVHYLKCDGRIWVKFYQAQKWVMNQNKATIQALKALK
jgi:hypothetical protein